jgi:hypothetical protein
VPRPGSSCLLALPLLLAAPLADARSYQVEYLDGHIARCSTMNTATLPEATLQQYRISADAQRGLLTCLVQEDRQELEPENVPAEVRARYRPVGHTWQEIPMQQIAINDLVSYLGVYDLQRAENLQFEVMVTVPAAGRMLLQFDDFDTAQ